MSKLTKNQKIASEKIEAGKTYSLKEWLRRLPLPNLMLPSI